MGPYGKYNLAKALSVTSNLTPMPQWVKVSTIPYLAFSAAATTLNVTLFSLVAGGMIHAIFIKHATAFAGGVISAATFSVGISGNNTKYAAAFDIFQAVSGTAFQLTNTPGVESMTGATNITGTITVTGANLSALTAGQVEVWALLSKITI